MSLALDVENLVKTYSNGVQALKTVSLKIQEGDFFALLGANGAGKTTLIGITTGLVNKTSGSVKVFDYDVKNDYVEARKMIGVVPQEFNFSMFEKVIDILVWQAGYYGIPRGQAIQRAHELLEKLDLKDKANLLARTLSGGMKRRLMIARALIHKPRFLILDEPTAGVDVQLRIGMWDYLREINQKEGVTILLTTHYLEEVEQMCKNAAIIKDGEIIMEDTVKNLLQSMENEIYTIETDVRIKDMKTIQFDITPIEDNTYDIVINKAHTINDLIRKLSDQNISTLSMRPKGNRLEGLFLNILQK